MGVCAALRPVRRVKQLVTMIRVPKMGMSTVEVDIGKVFVSMGDEISVGQPIAEIESEKVIFTVQAETPGKVTKIFVKPGDVINVGEPICELREE